jgi:hypothetical protein
VKGKVAFTVEDLGDARSIVDYVGRCIGLRAGDQSLKFLHRGQPCGSDPLRPTIGRTWRYGGRQKQFTVRDEVHLLHRFRRRVYPLLGKLTPLEALFVARHYGLPTRLLDWTANALFALYFSCASQAGVDGAVWSIRQRDDLERTALDPFELAKIDTEEGLLRPHASRRRPRAKPSEEQVKILFPILNSPRIVAQDGIFTLHANPHASLQDYSGAAFPPGEMDIHSVHCVHVRARYKTAILEELNGLGITHRTVFPDLDGIARSLWETEVLWSQPALDRPARGRR